MTDIRRVPEPPDGTKIAFTQLDNEVAASVDAPYAGVSAQDPSSEKSGPSPCPDGQGRARRLFVTDPLFGVGLGQRTLRTHTPDRCVGEHCCIHNPSDHHMRDWPQVWRGDRQLMERTCHHGVDHPDPDHVAYMRRVDQEKATNDGVHGCDGCCARPFEPIPFNSRHNYWTGEQVIEAYDQDDDAGIGELLTGRKVTKVADDHLQLDDGTLLKLIGHDGGCGCGAGDYELTELNGVNNVITRVEVESKPRYEGDENPEGTYKIFVFADNERINLATFTGSDGNSCYGTGFEILVRRPPQGGNR